MNGNGVARLGLAIAGIGEGVFRLDGGREGERGEEGEEEGKDVHVDFVLLLSRLHKKSEKG